MSKIKPDAFEDGFPAFPNDNEPLFSFDPVVLSALALAGIVGAVIIFAL